MPSHRRRLLDAARTRLRHHRYQDDIAGVLACHRLDGVVEGGQAGAVPSGQRQQMRVGDLAVADQPSGQGRLVAGHQFDVVGEEEMPLDAADLAEQGPGFPWRDRGRDRRQVGGDPDEAGLSLLAAVVGVLVLVAGIAGGILHIGAFFVPALVVLAVAAVKLWREQR
jgi:hypothetical protein